MQLYKTCREIPIHNFFELSRTGELKYLLKNYLEIENIEETPELSDVKINIIDEYNSLFKGKKNEEIALKAELVSLEIRLQNLLLIHDLFIISGKTPEILLLAKKADVELDEIEIYIKNTKSQIKKLENKVNSELENSENDTDSLEKTLSLVKENGFNFDRYTTPIIEFVFALNRLEEKAQYYESLKRK